LEQTKFSDSQLRNHRRINGRKKDIKDKEEKVRERERERERNL